MTPRELCQHGTAEPLKLTVHAALGLLAGACCAYNAAAFYYRRERHNGVNAVVYALVMALEVAHVRHHAER